LQQNILFLKIKFAIVGNSAPEKKKKHWGCVLGLFGWF
jgi:hypothetical protein